MRIVFISGLGSVVDNPCSDECQLYRYGFCLNREYYMCFNYQEWNNKPIMERERLLSDHFERVKRALIETNQEHRLYLGV